MSLDRRLLGWGLAAAVVLSAAAGPAQAAAATTAAPAVPAAQAQVLVLHTEVARSRPAAAARAVGTVAPRTPLTRVRTVLPVIGREVDDRGAAWVHVRLPGRPNGHGGWIRALRTRPASTAWHLVVDLSARTVGAYRAGRLQRRFRAVVGAPATPTPRGLFFVEEALALAGGDAGAPFALATSARSEVLQEFAGGPGQIALHGVGNIPSTFGTAASHGCVRLGTRAITWLAGRIGGGVPLTVRA